MNPITQPVESVAKTTSRRRCNEYRLVLDAAGIRSRTLHRDGEWSLEVGAGEAASARAELDAYRSENPVEPNRSSGVTESFDYSWTAVVVYVVVLVSVAVLTAYQAYALDWLVAGRMDAGLVRDGQWWRVVTALTLHLDIGHLMSNLVFGIVFGLMVGRTYGGGVAWLAIVVAGAFGNALNAWIQDANHTSIGASTAVFAALGMMVAHALRHWRDKSSRWTRWRPLIGGVALLAMTGIGGERTDVAAHFTGFIAGMAIGWIASRLNADVLSRRGLQQATGLVAIALIVVAWVASFA